MDTSNMDVFMVSNLQNIKRIRNELVEAVSHHENLNTPELVKEYVDAQVASIVNEANNYYRRAAKVAEIDGRELLRDKVKAQ